MNTPVSNSRENLEFYRNDPELLSTIPFAPRLLSGLVSFPYGKDGLLFIGAKSAQVIRGLAAKQLLAELLPLLDGRRRIDELVKLVSPKMQARVPEILALLSHRGMLENSGNPVDGDMPLKNYIARYLTVSRHHENAESAVYSIADIHLLLVAEHEISSKIKEMLSELNLRKLSICSTIKEIDKSVNLSDIDFILSLETGFAHQHAMLVAIARDLKIPLFYSKITDTFIQVGPFFSSPLSAGYGCVVHSMQEERTLKNGNNLDLKPHDHLFFLGYIYHQFVNTITKTTVSPLLNCYQMVVKDKDGYIFETLSVAQQPGLENGPLSNYEKLTNSDDILAWELHSRIRMPTKAMCGPSLYFQHYTVSNRKTQTSARPCFYTENVIALPEPVDQMGGGQLTPSGLSYLLKYSYGEQDIGEAKRLIAPSGGSLGSPDAYLMIASVAGIPNGFYRYRSSEHILEVLRSPSTELFKALLAQEANATRQCYLIGVAAVSRVASKYGEMAFKNTNLDSGVIQFYLQILCAKLKVENIAINFSAPRMIMEICNISANSFFITHVIGLGNEDSESKKETHTLTRLFSAPIRYRSSEAKQYTGDEFGVVDLGALLLRRRAKRRFSGGPVDYMDFMNGLKIASTQIGISNCLYEVNLPLHLWLILPFGTKDKNLEYPAGLYYYDQDSHTIISPYNASNFNPQRFSNQNSLVTAGAVVVVTLDMSSMLSQLGGGAYRLGYQSAGRALANLWLYVESLGYGGTISGGVLDDGFIEYASTDGYSHSALAMFAFGMTISNGRD